MKKIYGAIPALLVIFFYFLYPINVYASSYSATTNQIIKDAFANITASETQNVSSILNSLASSTKSDATSYINSKIKASEIDISSFSYSEYIRSVNDFNDYCLNLRNNTIITLRNQKKKDRDAILSDLDNIIASQKAKMQQDLFKVLLPYYMLPLQ